MKTFIKKVLFITGLISLAPIFSIASAATITCSPAYEADLVGKSVTISATIYSGSGNAYDYTWTGDEGLDANGQEISFTYSSTGSKTVNINAVGTDNADNLNGSCTVDIYTDATLPDFTASCDPSTDSAVIGQTITWNSNVNGPLGDYTISWTGSDLTNGVYENPEVVFTSAGNKTASMVSFQSRYGAETPIHNAKLSNVVCSTPVNVVSEAVHHSVDNPLSISGTCSASDNSINVNESVTWQSDLTISGGVAPYTISWTDNEGTIGSGNSVSKSYSSAGTKNASITIDDSAGLSTEKDCGGITVNTANDNSNNNGGSHHSSNNSNTTNDATSTPNNSSSVSYLANLINYLKNNGTNNATENVNYHIYTDYIFYADQLPGTYSEDVINLQNRLTTEGYYHGLIGGFFGPATASALVNYQKANGLTESGILDLETRMKLNGWENETEIASTSIIMGTTTATSTDEDGQGSGLTAAVSNAFGSAFNFIKNRGTAILFSILSLMVISQIYLLFRVLKRKE